MKQHQAIIPYIRGVTDKIGRIFNRQDTKTTYEPTKTIRRLLNNPEDKINLDNRGVYTMTCNEHYLGQTNRRISFREEEYKLPHRNQ